MDQRRYEATKDGDATMICSYGDFINALLEAGFSMGSSNAENIFTLCAYDLQSDQVSEQIRWHTGDAETDPWEWRMRVLDERQDITYAKVFFKKSGYITKQWYPYFLAARRGGKSFADAYAEGTITHWAKRIYEVVVEHGALPVYTLKQLAGFSREDAPKFDRALVELQMKMYLTMCGKQQKRSQKGQEYGWSSTVFCTVERFFGEDVWQQSTRITEREAIEKISAQIERINPKAEPKNMLKFIKG